ncbi:transcription elongation factor GreA [Thermus composti]|uniref:Transcription elongation factor GreA n=1 Tax=Thermus composti TaxID=532059 RepID=A0ABV6PZ96_9DEIN|nr:transcription elongation factor GreA [Thermus composti]GGN05522.1 transcription elongation factor GreA [Thermus composti]
MKKPVYLTPEGYKRLQEELYHLKTTKRQEISADFEQALEEGDLRENAGYDEARRAMWQNEARIAQLEDLLSRAVIVEGNGSYDRVALGCQVELETESGERLSLAIVGSHEADIFSGKISDESPLGQALLGKKVGDVVEIRGKKGAQVYTILEIKPL